MLHEKLNIEFRVCERERGTDRQTDKTEEPGRWVKYKHEANEGLPLALAVKMLIYHAAVLSSWR